MNLKPQNLKPVLILGAGPVGLGAALELARCNIPSILIERNDRTSWHPKTRNFNTRTMEIARGWGREIYDELRLLDLPEEWKSPIRFLTTVNGTETGNIESKGFKGAGPLLSPVNSVLSSQDMIEPVMLREVLRSKMVDVRFNYELVEFISGHENDAEEVIVKVKNKITDEVSILSGPAMIAADGVSSYMRRFLNMPLEGTLKIKHFINCYFKADIEQFAGKRPGILHFVANDQVDGVFQPLDAQGRWLCQIMVPEEQWSTEFFTHEHCINWIRAGVGVADLPIEVVSVGKWQMNAAVCRELQSGRVMLMGDAAHMFPPTGGLGVNTGLQGMHNCIWKLALFLKGKAGRALLDTYTIERKPVSHWVAEQSFHNVRQVHLIGQISKGLAEPTLSIDEVVRETRRYGNQLGLELGSTYVSSAVIPDGIALPEVSDPYTDYVPNACPGQRAPHVWLRKNDDTLSTLDLFGPEFTLITGKDGSDWKDVAQSISNQFGLDIKSHSIGQEYEDFEDTFLQRYGIESDGAVLVRPDGWVAWRSVKWNENVNQEITAALKQILALTSEV